MSRSLLIQLAGASCIVVAAPAAAQEPEAAGRAAPPETIDLLTDEERAIARQRRCEEEQAAASDGEEIVVCGNPEDAAASAGWSRSDWEDRYADRTRGADPLVVNESNLLPMVGATITIKGCFIPPCPPPMPLIIDLDAIPATPPGSDADRVGRGLSPRGDDVGDAPPTPPLEDERQKELGLPPPPEFERDRPDGARVS